MFGIKDSKVQERLLREIALTLANTDEICHSSESMLAQMKVVEDANYETTVNAVESDPDHQQRCKGGSDSSRTRDCWNYCGLRHEFHKESCAWHTGRRATNARS